MNITYVIIAIIAVILGWLVAAYNGFIRLVTRAQEAWADIDVQLKRRYDLIPNLISTVKGYAAHEAAAFEKVSAARSAAMGAATAGPNLAMRAAAENQLTGALGGIFAIAEAYPDLKANQNFLELQRELSDTENKIQAARRFYNTNVRDLNIKIDVFPSSIIAKMFKFQKMEFFQLGEGEDAAKDPVAVKF